MYAYCRSGRLGFAPDDEDTLFQLLRLASADRRRRRLPRNGLEILPGELEHPLGHQVAGQHQRQIVRCVVGLEELLQIRHLPRLDVGGPADRRKLVGVGNERGRLHLLAQESRVVIFYPQATLGSYDAALALDDFRHKSEVRHAIGLELEHQIQRAVRKPILVDRDVVARECIVGAALRLHQAIELARLAAGRAVEHHVLEEMCEPGDARRLVAASGAHPVIERHVRDVVHRPDDHFHAVRQRRRPHDLTARHSRNRRLSSAGQRA